MQTETIDVLFRAHPKESHGKITLESLTRPERTSRAIRRFAICWGIAIVTVFIPLAHFVLVPAFLLAGPVLAFLAYNAQTLVVGGEGACPSCQAPFDVVKGALQWPYSDTCAKCHSRVLIEPLNPAPTQA